jgi:hexosaminidase
VNTFVIAIRRVNLFRCAIVAAALIATLSCVVISFGANPTELALIPKPVKLEVQPGAFQLRDGMQIRANAEAKATADYLSDVLADGIGKRLAVVDQSSPASSGDAITIQVMADATLGDEGYRLTVNSAGVNISAATPAGAFYGVQTLRQLLGQGDDATSDANVDSGKAVNSIPFVQIEDRPRFAWRGLHLDVGRHFFNVDDVKRFLDLMALYKFNTFHWHLTEDQGWRIEIKKYPKLTEVGAWRDDGSGGRYGGFYTQDQIRDVVAYAAARHIRVVPEIEMPGHSQAALAAYPELSCTGGPFTVGTYWGIYKDVYCAGKDHTFDFLEDILTEVMDLFPGELIHIGGDECPKDRWKMCPDCQARIKAEGLHDEKELQSYFIKRIDKFVSSKGRRIIGWDEILEGGLAPGAAVMSWHGTSGAVAAAQADHDVVLSPTSNCYFDYPQAKSLDQVKAFGNLLPLEKVYSLNPMPSQLAGQQAAHVLGAQANLWTERIENAARLDYMTYPRACALAEVVWSPAENRSWDDFHSRLIRQLRQLDTLKVNYYKEPVAVDSPSK